jgi:hypothetical protein
MGYLDQYQHDVFVSYAHSELLTPWSEQLRTTLAAHLNELLEQKGDKRVDIWMDYRLEGNVGLTPQLRERVKGSALLLIVMSPFYLDSPWCKDEAEWFASECKAGDGRIFVVRCRPTDEARWPAFLKDERGTALRGYPFCRDDRRADAVSLPYGHPIPNDADQESRVEFYHAVTELAAQMQGQLRRLAKTTVTPIPQRSGMTRDQQFRTSGEQRSSANILLALSTEDVAPEQDALRAKLLEAGFKVLPEAEGSEPSSLPTLFAEIAPRCTAAAAILGALPGRSSVVDGQPFVRWQHEQIVRLGLPQVVWLPPTIDVEAIRDPDYRAFVGGIQAVRVADAGHVAAAVNDLLPGGGGPKRFIFLDAPQAPKPGAPSDQLAANGMEQDLRAILKNLNARVFPVARGRPTTIGLSEIEEYRRQLRALKAQCDAVLLLLQNPEQLPDLWLLEFERDIASAGAEPKAQRQPPRCAVIDTTNSYEPSESLKVFRYPNPEFQTEIRRWLN